jgi:hypothetical protein
MKNPVMWFMMLSILFSGAAGICTSLAALFHHPPTAAARDAAAQPAGTPLPDRSPP